MQYLEVLLHQRECVEIADAVIERRRALEIREQEGDLAHADAFAGADDLGAEQVSECLRGEEPLAGEERQETQLRHVIWDWRHHERAALGQAIAHVEGDLAGRERLLARRIVGAELDRRQLGDAGTRACHGEVHRGALFGARGKHGSFRQLDLDARGGRRIHIADCRR